MRLLFISWLLLVGVILFVNLVALSTLTTPPPNVQYYLEGAEPAIERMKLWPKVVAASRASKFYSYDMPIDFDMEYMQNCWGDDEWLRMYIDPYCMYLWMSALENGHVKSLDRILSVITAQERKLGEAAKSNQNGGMRCIFDGRLEDIGITGYWKPCTIDYLPMNGETFVSEIVAFHIDRILGFHRTPPVVPVFFETEQLTHLANEASSRSESPDFAAKFKLQTVMDKCGSPKGAEGAMVGWSNMPLRVLDKGVKQLKENRVINMFRLRDDELSQALVEFNITRDSPSHQITWALENVALNMFSILVANPQKFSHSVFALEKKTGTSTVFGPLVYVDNDRSSWSTDIFKRGVVKPSHPLGRICKFPLEIATRILSVNESAGFTVGKLVKESVAPYSSTFKEGVIFSSDNERWLDQRVHFLRETIEKCIHHHGVDNVLIPEPWYYDYGSTNMWMKAIPSTWLRDQYERVEGLTDEFFALLDGQTSVSDNSLFGVVSLHSKQWRVDSSLRVHNATVSNS